MPENKDSEFTWQDFQNRVNSELGNNLGNFVKRVSDLLHKFYDGVVPEFNRKDNFDESYFREIDSKLYSIQEAITGTNSIDETGFRIQGSAFNFRAGMFNIMQLSSYGNTFLQSLEPWKLIKTDENRVKEIMYTATQIVGAIAYSLKPFLPKTANKIAQIFNTKIEYNINDTKFAKGQVVNIIPSGTKINPSQILFPKIEDEQVQAQIEKLNKSKQDKNEILKQVQNDSVAEKSQIPNLKSQIEYDDFSKLDVRTGKIVEAEKVPKADKLLKLLVDIGIEQRTIVSGIAEHFSPEEIVGKEVSVLINLAPRKLRGIESNGMILMAEDVNGKLYFVNADGVSAGNIIK